MTVPLQDRLVPVHLLELPVPLAVQAQQHVEELMREFALITGGRDSGEAHHHVPRRLLQLVDVLTEQFAGVNNDASERLAKAIDSGVQVIDDHVLELPAEAGPASTALGVMLDEADDYCRSGQDLLTLATPDECVAYRRWYLTQVVEQLDGKPAVSWPDFLAGAPAS